MILPPTLYICVLASFYQYMQDGDCPLQLAKIVVAAYGFLLIAWLGKQCTTRGQPETACFRIVAAIVLVGGAVRAVSAKGKEVKECPEYSLALGFLYVPTLMIALQVVCLLFQCCWLGAADLRSEEELLNEEAAANGRSNDGLQLRRAQNPADMLYASLPVQGDNFV
jgi:hypothetical protein